MGRDVKHPIEWNKSKWQSQKSQFHYLEHFGQRRDKHGFLKINQWCKKKKKLKQNSIAELLATLIPSNILSTLSRIFVLMAWNWQY